MTTKTNKLNKMLELAFEENVFMLLKELKKFEYRIESIDLVWDVIFPDQKNKLYHIRINKYRKVFYLFQID